MTSTPLLAETDISLALLGGLAARELDQTFRNA